MAADISITIVGGGVIGSAIAYELSGLGKEVALLEKNPRDRGENQSSRNSGVIHAGIAYTLGSFRAEFCVKGNRMIYEFCREHNIPHKQTGKLVVAVKPWQVEYLEDTLRIAQENGVPDVSYIAEDEVRKIEPNVTCSEGALLVPTSGVIEPTSYVRKLQDLAEAQGAYFLFGTQLVSVESGDGSFIVTTENSNKERETFETEIVINAAGLYSDEVARLVNPEIPYSIAVARGEAAKFLRTKRDGLWTSGMNIYPTPYVTYNATGEVAEVSLEESIRLTEQGLATKTVGIHITPMLGNGVSYFSENGDVIVSDMMTIGPAKTPPVDKEDYRPIRESPYYHSRVTPFFSGLRLEDIELHQTGNMANPAGGDDWIIRRDANFRNWYNLIGINTPGLTSSLAIAKFVDAMMKED